MANKIEKKTSMMFNNLSFICIFAKHFVKKHLMEHMKVDSVMVTIHLNFPIANEIHRGHVRYSTTGKRAPSFIHLFDLGNKNIYQ